MKNRMVISVLLILMFMLIAPYLLWAGNLNPSAPPTTGTMKTLDEVEPRIPISSVPYIISESGSYYLSINAYW